MTFQLQSYKAVSTVYAGPNRNRFLQYMFLNISSAATDTSLDISSDTNGSLGTFWTAVTADATYGAVGSAALATIQNIRDFLQSAERCQFGSVACKTKSFGIIHQFLGFLSAASVGGAATENYTVTGLAVGDVVESVTPAVAVANSVFNISYGAVTANTLPVTYSGDPGSGGKVRVFVSRNGVAVTPTTGQYQETITGHLPTITFAASNAPTSQLLILCGFCKTVPWV